MIITIFGASSPDEAHYEEAYELGKYLGSKGHTIKNGGYSGTMEATAKGCQASGGKTIGVCIKGHKIDTMGRPNDYLDDVIITDSVKERIQVLMNADRIIVLKGSVGTLEELFVSLSDAVRTERAPIITYGEEMKNLITYLSSHDFFKEIHKSLIQTAEDTTALENYGI